MIDEDKPGVSVEAMNLALKLIEQFDVIESQERRFVKLHAVIPALESGKVPDKHLSFIIVI